MKNLKNNKLAYILILFYLTTFLGCWGESSSTKRQERSIDPGAITAYYNFSIGETTFVYTNTWSISVDWYLHLRQASNPAGSGLEEYRYSRTYTVPIGAGGSVEILQTFNNLKVGIWDVTIMTGIYRVTCEVMVQAHLQSSLRFRAGQSSCQ